MPGTETFEARWGSLVVTSERDSLIFTRAGSFDGPNGVEVARFEADSRLLCLLPREGVDHGANRAYAQVREIQIDTAVWTWDPDDPIVETDQGELQLAGLPEGLGVTFGWGLRLPMHYRRLIREVEVATDCTVICLGSDNGISGDTFHLSLDAFASFIREIELHRGRAGTVLARLNDAVAHNVVAEALGRATHPASPGRLPAIKSMTQVISGESDFDEASRAELLDLVAAESRRAATEQPEAFGRLRTDLDLVTLEVLIDQFSTALSGPTAGKERTWQSFFGANVFALQQLFAAPVTYVGEQLRVRLPNLYGTGAQEPDFLLVNSVAKSVYLVEIKTPATKMLSSNYRGRDEAEVFPPHRDLSGAVAQLQSQIHSALVDLPGILQRTSGAPDVNPGVVRGAVIAGSMTSLSAVERQSFMRYRQGLFGVEIITFDEVLDRLKGLHRMLTGSA